jgi:RuvB-like protein 1 (pontin 52)
VPVDLLDRLLIIRTSTYTGAEIKSILSVRAEVEGITIDEDALEGLSQIGEQCSLRYAVQLLTPSRVLAQTNGRDAITADDVMEINELFFDAKQSAKLLQAQAAKFLQ